MAQESQRRFALLCEIEALLNRFGGEMTFDRAMMEVLSYEELVAILELLQKKSENVTKEHHEWLLGLAEPSASS